MCGAGSGEESNCSEKSPEAPSESFSHTERKLGRETIKRAKAEEETGKCSRSGPSPPLRELRSGTPRRTPTQQKPKADAEPEQQKTLLPGPQYRVRRQ